MDVSEPVAARNPPDPAPLAVDDHGAVVHTPVMRERITALLDLFSRRPEPSTWMSLSAWPATPARSSPTARMPG